ncbi:hypothetical protein O6H91_20G047600 [Diphasiastrum complanatum]|uniref:Uncharacterized protein n=1 Tax=Diphasiastrum complanatum TaxID=34168 RepID=A0ACC2AQ25_DIPCM|nr:hypothetical protein O6H91_20G047600 [Diphasiastrum complanatum]
MRMGPSLFNEGGIEDIADPRLTTYNIEAMWKVAKIAISSVELPGIDRPNMSDIVIVLKEAIAIENNNSHKSLSGTNSWQSFHGSKKKRYYSCPDIQNSCFKPATTSFRISHSFSLEGR